MPTPDPDSRDVPPPDASSTEQSPLVLFGQLDTPLPPADIASMLRGAGVAAQLREKSHFTGGAYVRILPGAETHFTLERIPAGTYLARGDAEDGKQLSTAARRVSSVLAWLGIRHRLELYDDDERMVAYLHHAWPSVDEVESG